MSPINIPAIEREARRMRAEEMRRISGLVSARMGQYGGLLLATARSGLAAIGEGLRPLFSWNPRAEVSRTPAGHPTPALLTRLNRVARGLFGWNPRNHRSC